MASTKVALLLLGTFALAAVASADDYYKGAPQGGKMYQGQYWESKGAEKVDKDWVHDQPKPPKEPKDHVDKPYPKKIVIDKHPPMHAPPQEPAKPRFKKPTFNITKAQPSPKPAKVKIVDVKEPKIIDHTEPYKNNEKFPKPEFRKVWASPSPKPAKVKIIDVKEPKIIDHTEPYHNKEKYPKPEFRKVYASPSPKPVKVITPKIVEAPIKDITQAPPKVTKGWMDPPGKNTIKQDKGMPTKEIFKRYFAVAGDSKDSYKN